MEYIGTSVRHNKYGKGIIKDISEKYVFVLFDLFPTELKKFPFPMCFEKILHVDDDFFREEMADKILDYKKINERKEQLDLQEQRVGRVGINALRPNGQGRARRQHISGYIAAGNDRIRGNNLKGLETATSISIEDNYYFDRSVDVLNAVFHKDYGAWMRGFCYLNDEKTIGVWFPKMAIIENGIEVSQSTTKSWVNKLSSDGMEIRAYTNDREYANHSPRREPHITFAKFPGQPYKYIGTFLRDLNRSTPMDIYYERIATSFDLSEFRR